MSQTKLPKWAIIAIAALVLFGIGSAVYNSGWSQGFLMGLLTSNAEGTTLAPYLASQTQGWHPGGGFGFFGGIFKVFFFIVLFGLLMKFLGFCHWRRHGWQGGPGWHGWQGEQNQQGQASYGPWWQQAQQPPQAAPQTQPQAGEQPSQPTPPASEAEQGPKPQPVSWTRV